MHKHKLIELQKIIEEKIGSLIEEVEIGTNVKLNPLYIADRRDEIEFLQWIIRIISSILSSRVKELSLRLKDCNNLQESDILINEIDTLESVLGRLSDLKYGDKARDIEIAEANNDFQQANRLRKQIIKIQDIEDEISAQCSNTKLRWTS